MNTSIKKLALMLILLGTLFSGCTEQNTTPENKQPDATGAHDEVLVTPTGGSFSLAESRIILNISDDAIDGNVLISIDELTGPPTVPGVSFLIGYDLQPNGFEFLAPVTLELFYDDTTIPAGVTEEELKIYAYENNQLTESSECQNFLSINSVRGTITQLGVYWICGPAGSSSGHSNTSGGPSGNHSAMYRFQVDTLEVVEQHTFYPNETNPQSETYRIDGYFVWDPVTYVRFYEVQLNSTGPYPATLRSLKWSDYQNSGHTSPAGWLLFEDHETYIYGDYKFYPGYGEFVTIYNNLRGNFPTKHGISMFHIWDSWDVSPYSIGYVEPSVVQANIKAMKEAFYEWTQAWSITVRAVT